WSAIPARRRTTRRRPVPGHGSGLAVLRAAGRPRTPRRRPARTPGKREGESEYSFLYQTRCTIIATSLVSPLTPSPLRREEEPVGGALVYYLPSPVGEGPGVRSTHLLRQHLPPQHVEHL